MEVMKESKQNIERETHTGQVRQNKDIFAMMDTALCEQTASLIISRRLPDLHCSIVKGVRTAQTPPHLIHTTPVPTRGISGTR